MNTVRSEWTKIRSLRSTWTMAAAVVLSGLALSVLGAWDFLGTPVSDLPDDWDPTGVSLKGFLFAQLVIGMLGAFSITPEYRTGSIATSLAFVPSRSRLLSAKTLVVGAVSLVAATVTAFGSFAVVQVMLAGAGLPTADITDAAVFGALVGAALYLTLIALVGLAVGTIIRSTAGALAVLVGALLLVPAVAPGLFGAGFGKFWPVDAGQAVYRVVRTAGDLAPWLGLGILAASTVVVTAAGHAVLRIRDQ